MASLVVEKGQEILDLVSTALAQDRRSGLSEMLQSVARAIDAFGCILWQETPISHLDADPPTGQFFVLAEWFEGPERSNLHNLPLRSATGEAVLHRQPVSVSDAHKDLREDKADPFLSRVGIRCFCSVPITFLDGVRGALNIYRTEDKPFSEREIANLQKIVSLLPSLYQTIVDKISFLLVRTVNRILQEAEGESPQSASVTERFERIAEKICREIADSLQALEVSIFLEDRLDHPGLYNLMATTWPAEEQFTKTYRADPDEGVTGWVLSHRREVRIFDLANFEAELEQLQELYPGLRWEDSLHIATSVPRILKIPKGEKLQPLSFVAVPIVISDRLLGAVRCCTIKEGPFHLAEQEVRLLKLVAAQIGQAWSHWLSQREIEEENNALQGFVTSIGELNRFVQQQVVREIPDERSIFDRALQATSSVIPNAEISDVRLLDEESEELYFEATYGRAWDSGTPEEVRARRARRFLIHRPPMSAGAHVVNTEQVYIISDTSDNSYFYSETFPNARRVIIAPIGISGKIFGVLDIRSTSEREFPRHAVLIAELLGQQLGLYHYLLGTIAELQRLPRIQGQTFEDFIHQLKTPLLQVHTRAESLLQLGVPSYGNPKIQSQLFALRGLAAKARRVVQSLGIFADLALGKPLMPLFVPLQEGKLIKMLIESTMDQESLLLSNHALSFQVARHSFESLRVIRVLADPDLLFLAINNLLDNASKYSYPNTSVVIEGGLTGSGRFHISVLNTGLPITGPEARRCMERGWRSESARDVSGEGSGIGLWITRHIMEAHNGELMVIPTARDNLTEIKLLFPTDKARNRESNR